MVCPAIWVRTALSISTRGRTLLSPVSSHGHCVGLGQHWHSDGVQLLALMVFKRENWIIFTLDVSSYCSEPSQTPTTPNVTINLHISQDRTKELTSTALWLVSIQNGSVCQHKLGEYKSGPLIFWLGKSVEENVYIKWQ